MAGTGTARIFLLSSIPMNVTVFGATGAIGSRTVAGLVERGHTVTAYARNRAKIPKHTWGARVRVVIGQMPDANAIGSAVAGAGAVVSALGPSLDRKATGLPLAGGTRHILEAMKRHGVRRYAGNGTPSVPDQRDRPNWQAKVSTFRAETFLRPACHELAGMSEIVTSSGPDWTIVRFLAPNDGPATGQVRQGFSGRDSLGFNVTRADIAAFTAAQVDDERYVGAAPAISN